jgi:hypothetical protein
MKNFKILTNSLMIIILSGLQTIFGQANEGTIITTERPDLELAYKLRLERNMNSRVELSYEKIDGDPFLYKDLTQGKLTLRTGEKIPLDLRYDIYKGEIQFRQKDGIYTLINGEGISEVLIDTLKFIYSANPKKSPDNGPAETSWFIVKVDGKGKLLIRKNIRLQAATTEKPYQEPQPPKFIHLKDTYYIKHESQGAVKINGKKDLLNALSDKEDVVSNYIKTNKLDVKELDDLVKIITYYNNL